MCFSVADMPSPSDIFKGQNSSIDDRCHLEDVRHRKQSHIHILIRKRIRVWGDEKLAELERSSIPFHLPASGRKKNQVEGELSSWTSFCKSYNILDRIFSNSGMSCCYS